MSSSLRLEVVTPEGKVFSSDVTEIQFPTRYRGYYGILPDHTPVLAPLGDGLITCLAGGKKVVLTVFGGFAEVGPVQVNILARESDAADKLDQKELLDLLRGAEQSLKNAKDSEEQQRCLGEINACKLRLQAIESAQ
jgi:F-type H+-transporting ATPase subunit epsilon